MRNTYLTLILLCCLPKNTTAQLTSYPQTYHLKGKVDHIQFISLDRSWNDKGWEEQDNNTIYFKASHQPDKIVFGNHRNVEKTTFRYQEDLLWEAISIDKQGNEFAKTEFRYENNLLIERQTTYLKSAFGMNSHFIYQHLPGDTIVGKFEQKKEVFLHGRLLSTQGEGLLDGAYRYEFTYNEQGDVDKIIRLDKAGKVVKEVTHQYEYDDHENYIQRVTADETGDTTGILLRKITYRGDSPKLVEKADFIGKWLLVMQHPELKGIAFIMDFKEDSSLYCKEAREVGLTDTGRWAVDFKNQRIKLWFEKMGFRVNFQKVDDQTLQIHWDALEDAAGRPQQALKDTYLYKIN